MSDCGTCGSHAPDRSAEQTRLEARDIATLQRQVTTGRLGEEVYPLILLLAVIVFCGEHLVANWFYSEESETAQVGEK